MPNLTTLILHDNIRCTCCGEPAQLEDEDHGALCWECLRDLAEIEEFLRSLSASSGF